MPLFNIINTLIVDDEEPVVNLVTEVLTLKAPPDWPFQYKIKAASTLQTALKYIPGGLWDIIFLDLGLPDSQSISTFRACQAVAKAPIVVFTGTVDWETRKMIMSEGAARCYSKADIIGCIGILHHIVNHVLYEDNLVRHNRALEGAVFGNLRKLKTACSICHRWQDPETGQFLSPKEFLERVEIYLTHTFCPECAQKKYSDVAEIAGS